MSGRMEFTFNVPRGARKAARREDAPFRMLLIADLSGRDGREADPGFPALDARRPVAVDVDGVDALLAKLAPRISLDLAPDAALDLAFTSFEHFSADHLYRTLPVFATFRDTRARLMDPATFAEAAGFLSSALAPDAATAPAEDQASLFERLLGRAPDASSPAARARHGLDRFLADAVKPHLVPSPDPRRDEFVRAVDEAAAFTLRTILRHPRFRALESAWAALTRWVSSLDTGEELKLYVLDVTRDDLFADLRAAGPRPEESALHRMLVDRDAASPGGFPWSLLVPAFAFRPTPEDAGFAAALAAVASAAGGPILAGGDAAFLGISSVSASPDPKTWTAPAGEGGDAWRALRRSPWAEWLGLTLPRILYRLPYGARGDRCEALTFEEIEAGADAASAYPLGSAAPYAAELVARAFLERGWDGEPGDLLDVDDLPAFVTETDGEQRLAPTAEAFLGERGGESLLAHGFIPVISYRDRGAARVLRFQSFADPPTPLAGAWNGGR